MSALKRSIFNNSPAKFQRKISQEYEAAVYLIKRGRIVEAEKQVEQYLEYTKTTPHGNDVATVIEASISMMRLKIMSFDLSTVTSRCADLLGSASRRFGADSIQVADVLFCQAECFRIQSANSQSESHYNKALSLLCKLRYLDVDHAKLAWLYSDVLYGLCLLYLDTGVFERVYLLLKDFEKLKKEADTEANHVFSQMLLIKGMLEAKKGSFDVSKNYYEEVIALVEITYGREHPFVGTALHGLGSLMFSYSLYSDALEYFDTAIELQQLFYPVDHISIVTSQCLKGRTLHALGCYPEAYSLLSSSLEKIRNKLGSQHTYVARALVSLATTRQAMAHPKQAQVWFDHAIKLIRATCQADGVDYSAKGSCKDMADAVFALATNYEAMGKHKEALGLYHESFQIYTNIAKLLRVDDESDLAAATLAMANVVRAQGQLKNSQALLGKAGIMTMKLFGETSLRSSECLYGLGWLTSDLGRNREAHQLFNRALTIAKEHLPPNHPQLAFILQAISENFRRVGYYDNGLEPLRASHALLAKRFPPSSLPIAQSLFVRAKVLSDLGHSNDADLMFQASLVMIRESIGESNAIYLYVLLSTAECLRLQSRSQQAESALKQALLIAKECYDPKHPVVSEVLTTLTLILLAADKTDEAEAVLLENILPLDKELLGESHHHTVFMNGLLGMVRNKLNPGSGQELISNCLTTFCNEKNYTSTHPWVKILGGYPETLHAKKFHVDAVSPLATSPIGRTSSALEKSWRRLDECKKNIMTDIEKAKAIHAQEEAERMATAAVEAARRQEAEAAEEEAARQRLRQLRESETDVSEAAQNESNGVEVTVQTQPKEEISAAVAAALQATPQATPQTAPQTAPQAASVRLKEETPAKKLEPQSGGGIPESTPATTTVGMIQHLQKQAKQVPVVVPVAVPIATKNVTPTKVEVAAAPASQESPTSKAEERSANEDSPQKEIVRVKVATAKEPEVVRNSLPKLGGAKSRKSRTPDGSGSVPPSPSNAAFASKTMSSSGGLSQAELDALRNFRESLNSRQSPPEHPGLDQFEMVKMPDKVLDFQESWFQSNESSDGFAETFIAPVDTIAAQAASSAAAVSAREELSLPPTLSCPAPLSTAPKVVRPKNLGSSLPRVPAGGVSETPAVDLFSKTIGAGDALSMEDMRRAMSSE